MPNQIEIGKFIAKCRKEKKATQAQLAEFQLQAVGTCKFLLTFDSASLILLCKQGDYSVVEKAEPDPLNLLANTNAGS